MQAHVPCLLSSPLCCLSFAKLETAKQQNTRTGKTKWHRNPFNFHLLPSNFLEAITDAVSGLISPKTSEAPKIQSPATGWAWVLRTLPIPSLARSHPSIYGGSRFISCVGAFCWFGRRCRRLSSLSAFFVAIRLHEIARAHSVINSAHTLVSGGGGAFALNVPAHTHNASQYIGARERATMSYAPPWRVNSQRNSSEILVVGYAQDLVIW